MQTRFLRATGVVVAGVVIIWAGAARAANFSYECVDNQYSACGGSNVPNRCTNARGLANVLAAAGHTQLASYSGTNVWNSDSMESNLFSYGNDTTYTDTGNSDLWFFSGHGTCYGWGTQCSSDADCNRPGTSTPRCDLFVHECRVAQEPVIRTCSSFDTSSSRIAHATSITNEMRFGESSATGGWGGVGTNGNANIVVFDSSCAFNDPYYVEENAPFFVGAHLQLGFSGEGGDALDIGERGGYLAERLVDGEGVGPAWHDTSRFDAPYGLQAGVCVTALACADGSTLAQFATDTEEWPYSVDPVVAPTWCRWSFWCNF